MPPYQSLSRRSFGSGRRCSFLYRSPKWRRFLMAWSLTTVGITSVVVYYTLERSRMVRRHARTLGSALTRPIIQEARRSVLLDDKVMLSSAIPRQSDQPALGRETPKP